MRLILASLLLVFALAPASGAGGTVQHWENGNLTYEDTALTPAYRMWEDCPLLAIEAEPFVGSVFCDDFFGYTSGDKFSATLTDTGTVVIDALGLLDVNASGVTADDNDEAYLGSTDLNWVLAAGNDLWFETVVKLTEANTDDANIIVGLSSTYAANTLQDNGAGPPANYDGIVFFKVDGGTVWQFETSSGSGTQTTNTNVGAFTSGSWFRLGFKVTGASSVTAYINGVAVATHTTYLPDNNVGLIMGVKNGGANEETLFGEYVKIVQLR